MPNCPNRNNIMTMLALLLLLSVSIVHATTAFFPRYPVLSPDGSTLVFSCQGDLWTVSSAGGRAMRLTANPGYDRSPMFSPDGKTIAFSSDRSGTHDIFAIPANGGTPIRLSYGQTTELVQDWSRDGKSILYSARGQFDYPMSPQIFQVQTSGSTPSRLVDCFAEEVAVGSESTYLLTIGHTLFGRKGYRGSDQSDIYRYETGKDPVQLTTHRGYDFNPLWSLRDNLVYFISDSSGSFNIWRMNSDGTNKIQITSFKDDGPRYARLSQTTHRIIIEADSSLYLLDLANPGKLQQLKIDIADDEIESPINQVTFSSNAEELAVSSDGSDYAMTIHGEIVLVNRELGGRAVVPVPSVARDCNPAFKPGTTDTVLFTTDRWGYQALTLLVPDDTGKVSLRKARHFNLLRLTKDSADCHDGKWSPKGDRIAYIHGKGQLRMMNSDGSDDHILVNTWSETQFSWSPDSKWIAYATEDYDFNSDIWVVPVDGSIAPVNISMHPDNDENPVWSADGRILSWQSLRHHKQMDVYFVYLRKSDNDRTDEEWKEWEKTRDKNKSDDSKKDSDHKGKKEKKSEAKGVVADSVVIDFEDIYLRARRITDMNGGENIVAIHPKGDRFYFTADLKKKRDLYSVNRFGEDLKAVTDGGANPGSITLDADGKTFYFLRNGTPASIGSDGGKSENTNFRATLRIDQAGEWLQILDECWRRLGSTYYDSTMHGANWQALRNKYRTYAMNVKSDIDFEDVVELLLGELNSSHTGYSQPRNDDKTQTAGELGLTFDRKYKANGLKVASVLRNGPCDKAQARILPGDILTAINGEPVSSEVNLNKPLEGKTGEPVLLTIIREGKEQEISVIPANWFAIRQLVYQEMEKKNRETVTQKSKNRVAYIHIQGMDEHSMELFQRDLYAAADGRDALIIDVRNNGGGHTCDLLLTTLTQPQHAYTISRGGGIGFPQDRLPMYRWNKPIAVLCNEGSFSNAEIFSHAIQTIKRGPVVGWETAGGVISTGGWQTINGGNIRQPGRGWWVYGTKLEEEHHGCVPDYPVPMTPADRIAGRDPQLDKAIDLMNQAVYDTDHRPGPMGEIKQH